VLFENDDKNEKETGKEQACGQNNFYDDDKIVYHG
jgi:hypothetical protein